MRKTKRGNLNHNAFQLQKKGEDVEAQNQRGEDVKKPAPPQPPLLPVRPTPQNYIRILLFFLHLFFLNEESQSSSAPPAPHIITGLDRLISGLQEAAAHQFPPATQKAPVSDHIGQVNLVTN